MDFVRIVRFAFLGRIIKGVSEAFLTAIGKALNNLRSKIEVMVDNVYYDLTITPQVCYLEQMLNDYFDSNQRRIYIEETETVQGYYLFRNTDPEYMKFYFGHAWFVEDTRYSNTSAGFTVVLPTDIKATDKMRALIERYKLISVKYLIINR